MYFLWSEGRVLFPGTAICWDGVQLACASGGMLFEFQALVITHLLLSAVFFFAAFRSPPSLWVASIRPIRGADLLAIQSPQTMQLETDAYNEL